MIKRVIISHCNSLKNLLYVCVRINNLRQRRRRFDEGMRVCRDGVGSYVFYNIILDGMPSQPQDFLLILFLRSLVPKGLGTSYWFFNHTLRHLDFGINGGGFRLFRGQPHIGPNFQLLTKCCLPGASTFQVNMGDEVISPLSPQQLGHIPSLMVEGTSD